LGPGIRVRRFGWLGLDYGHITRRRLHNAVQLGIDVVEAHLKVGESLGQRNDVLAGGQRELLQNLQHGLLKRFP
jgi:hypothetical protein